MTQVRASRRSQEEWLQSIRECRCSGLSDRTWCEQHGILTSSFYNAVKRLRKKAKASAMIYSLVETAKANGINTYKYFELLLTA